MSPAPLTEEAVRAALGHGRELGAELRVVPLAVTVESLALQWARQEDAPEGATVIADHELSGRVRRTVPWVSVPSTQLAVSVVLRPALPPSGEGLLWLLTSLAAAEAVAEVSGLDARLKWPNDVLIADRRLGGIRVDAQLVPGRIDIAIVTARFNVLSVPPALVDAPGAAVTSLHDEGADTTREALLVAYLDRLAARYAASVPELLEAYRAACDTIGERVHAFLAPSGEAVGRARDVSASGALLLETGAGEGGISIDRLVRLERA